MSVAAVRRRGIAFDCEGATLIGTLDQPAEVGGGAAGDVGLLVIGGGNEIRSGAWAGQALFAAEIARAGFAVLRFDRRGIGDSDGPNGGFRSAQPDISAAIGALQREAGVRRTVGFGNCEGASALMLGGAALRQAGVDAVVLSNPWTFDAEGDAAMPVQALRTYYRRRLANNAALRRLVSGKVTIATLLRSVGRMLRAPALPTTLAAAMAQGLTDFADDGGAAAILIAGRDRTADAFLARWDAGDARVRVCAAASHSFVEAEAREWLVGEVLAVLREAAGVPAQVVVG